eukprot:scaffold185_cov233-Chaetoceros_neogracile.AAC.2
MGSERLAAFCTRIGFERLSVFFTRIVSEKAVDVTVSDFLPGGGEETFHDNDDTGRNDDWKNNDTKNDEQKEKVEAFRDRMDVELSVIEEAASLVGSPRPKGRGVGDLFNFNPDRVNLEGWKLYNENNGVLTLRGGIDPEKSMIIRPRTYQEDSMTVLNDAGVIEVGGYY